MKQTDSVIKGKLYDTTKEKIVIVSAILYGDLTDTWNENMTTVTNEMANKVKTDAQGVVTKYKTARGPYVKAFEQCLLNLREFLLLISSSLVNRKLT